MPHINSRRDVSLFILQKADMTAYLISLALCGLVAIAVWEGLS
jgi:hypothetical protein